MRAFSPSRARSAFLVVRLLQAWRAFKRLRRHLGKELDRLADARPRQTADERGPRVRPDEARRRASAGCASRSRSSPCCAGAVDEATDAFGRFTALYPRK